MFFIKVVFLFLIEHVKYNRNKFKHSTLRAKPQAANHLQSRLTVYCSEDDMMTSKKRTNTFHDIDLSVSSIYTFLIDKEVFR